MHRPMAEMVKEPRRAGAIQEAVHTYRMTYVGGDRNGRRAVPYGETPSPLMLRSPGVPRTPMDRLIIRIEFLRIERATF